jgi:hypothetical protein
MGDSQHRLGAAGIAKVKLIAIAVSLLAGLIPPASAHAGPPCTNAFDPSCHSVSADQVKGDFRGLIMVPGQPGVLDLAAHSGTQPGCGDCVWTLVIACVFDSPNDPHNQISCNGAGQGRRCGKGQTAYRLFLTTDAVTNQFVGTLCLGGPADVIPVSDIAGRDVDRYLRDVIPPAMHVTVQPPNGALSNLPAYFQVQPPALQPQQFGGPRVIETITITPAHYTWDWGDGTEPLETDDPGAPYPDGHVTHTYDRAAHLTVALTTEWSATYTITVAGQTLGPFNATGTVQHTQRFPLVVDRARSHLVSH